MGIFWRLWNLRPWIKAEYLTFPINGPNNDFIHLKNVYQTLTAKHFLFFPFPPFSFFSFSWNRPFDFHLHFLGSWAAGWIRCSLLVPIASFSVLTPIQHFSFVSIVICRIDNSSGTLIKMYLTCKTTKRTHTNTSSLSRTLAYQQKVLNPVYFTPKLFFEGFCCYQRLNNFVVAQHWTLNAEW